MNLKQLFPTMSMMIVFLTVQSVSASNNKKLTDDQIAFFEKKIRPVLVNYCYKCHSTDSGKSKAGLNLDSRAAMMAGGDSGPALVPGNLKKSLILSAIKYEHDLEMPPKEQLPDHVIADFQKWIKMGAPDPRDQILKPKPTESLQAAKNFWSFQKPQKHPQPKTKSPEWIKRPLDAFVLNRLESKNLKPNLQAAKRTLARRVYYDLAGLPPTTNQLNEYINDTRSNAYELLVKKLLESEKYGEHWARLWLDLSRYAEDQAHIVGNDRRLCYPNAYLYRDWVINAFNKDIPFDEFVRLQLADDLMNPNDETHRAALGFIGLGPKYYNRNDPLVKAEEWEDRVDVVTRGLLGLTVACARCHDHKYDPVTTEDYYALAGVFASTQMHNAPLTLNKDQTLEKTDNKNTKPKTVKPEESMHIIRDSNVTDINVQRRGDPKNKGPIVPRRFLPILTDGTPPAFKQGSGRLELASAIVSRNNPVTARVFVNRIWARLIGQPLVATQSNFGLLGDEPTHPKLLDDLSVRFMDNGWSVKWLIAEIVNSATYQQASNIDSHKVSVDPSNKLLWRMNRKRMTFEQWRDSLLSASGQLNHTIGGKSINPQDPKQVRRTVYSEVSRLDLNKMMQLFDFPDPNAHSPGRVHTTTPLQKMFVLNSPFVVKQADVLAEKMIQPENLNLHEQINNVYLQLYSRQPTSAEVKLGAAFVSSNPDQSYEKWKQYTQALLAANEFYFID